MNIKKSIVGSLFSMLLVSEMAAANWGDVYYCQMTNSDEITLEGEKKNYILGKFQFKLDQTKNAMVFGDKGFFENVESELVDNFNWPSLEAWRARTQGGDGGTYFFEEGKLLFAYVGTTHVNVISADCEKF